MFHILDGDHNYQLFAYFCAIQTAGGCEALNLS